MVLRDFGIVSIRARVASAFVAATLLAGLVVWMAGAGILRPLNDLTKSARQIETGNLDLELPTRAGKARKSSDFESNLEARP